MKTGEKLVPENLENKGKMREIPYGGLKTRERQNFGESKCFW
jgi:hypothetical protein